MKSPTIILDESKPPPKMARIPRDDDDFAYLADVGITPGVPTRIVDIAPFRMFILGVDDSEQAVPEAVAASIRVSAQNDAGDLAHFEQREDA